MRATVDVQAWPGTAGYRAPSQLQKPERFSAHQALILHNLALPGKEELGLGAWLTVRGQRILDGGLVVPDDLADDTRLELERWAASQLLATPIGKRPLRVLSRSQFVDVKEKGDHLGPFIRVGYWGKGTIAAFGLGRSLALLADRWAPGKLAWSRGWSLHFDPWEHLVTDRSGRECWKLRSNRPTLRVRSLGSRGTQAEFGPAPSFKGQQTGVWESNGRPFKGRFLDLLTAASSLDGIDDDDMGHHFTAWGLDLPPGGPHLSALPNVECASLVVSVVHSLHVLALKLDTEAARWHFDLPALISPGTAANQPLARIHVEAPLARQLEHQRQHESLVVLALRQGARQQEAKTWANKLVEDRSQDVDFSKWTAALHGGLVKANPKWTGHLFEGVDVDIRSAYPAIAELLGWWRYICADRHVERTATSQLRSFLAKPDLATLMRDAKTWEQWGLTRCTVQAKGEPLPLYFSDYEKMAVVPTYGQIDCTWLDAVAATLSAGHPVDIVEAWRLVPEGAQQVQNRRTPAGILGADPVPALFALRQQAKESGDWRTAGWLRIMLNSLTYGNLCRFDPDSKSESEKPGPWCFPPLAATITAGTRLLIMLLERDTELQGGGIAYCDTDGAIIAGLSTEDVGAMLASYNKLCPWGGNFWAIKTSAQCYVFGSKKYVFLDGTTTHTETSIGAAVPPPSMPHQDPVSGMHEWVAETEALLAQAPEDAAQLDFPWGTSQDEFPYLERYVTGSTSACAQLPKEWHARPFARTVGAHRDDGLSVQALDPGGDLTNWQYLDWWVVGSDGARGVLVTTQDYSNWPVHIEALYDKVMRWGMPSFDHDLGPVHLDDRLIRRVGSRARSFKGWVDEQPVYKEIDKAGLVTSIVRLLGPSRFAEVTGTPLDTVKRLALGQRKAASSTLHRLRENLGPDPLARLLDLVEGEGSRCCALEGCDHPVHRTNAQYCNCQDHGSHREAAKKRRQRASVQTNPQEATQ